MSGHRPPGMRGRGRARYRDKDSPSPTPPGHKGTKDIGDGRESPSDVWKHDRYSRSEPHEVSEGTNSQAQERTDNKREPANPERQKKVDRVRNRRPDVQVYVPRARRQQAGTDMTSPQTSTTSAKTDTSRKVRPGREVFIPRHQQQQQQQQHQQNDSIPVDTYHDSLTENVQQCQQPPDDCNNATETWNTDVNPEIHASKKIKVFDKRKHFEKYMQKVDYQSFPPTTYQNSDEEQYIGCTVPNKTDIKTSQEEHLNCSNAAESMKSINNVENSIETSNLEDTANIGIDSRGVVCDTDQNTSPSILDNNTNSIATVDPVLESTYNTDCPDTEHDPSVVTEDGKEASEGDTITDEHQDQSVECGSNIYEPVKDTRILLPNLDADINKEDVRPDSEHNNEKISKTDEFHEKTSDIGTCIGNEKVFLDQNVSNEKEVNSCDQDKGDLTNHEKTSVIDIGNSEVNIEIKDRTTDIVSADSEEKMVIDEPNIENKTDRSHLNATETAVCDKDLKDSNTVELTRTEIITTSDSEIMDEDIAQLSSTANQSEAEDPDVDQSEAEDPDVDQSEVEDSDVHQSEAEDPDVRQSEMEDLDVHQSEAEDPVEDNEPVSSTTHQSEVEDPDIHQSEAEDPDEDSWDAMFNDDGDCLDPKALEELTKTVGNVKIQKSKKISYLDYQPKDKGNFDYTQYAHIIEIYDFPKEFVTRDLIMAFQSFMSRGFDLKWVDDTHALGIFSSNIAAQDALMMAHPLVKVRSLLQASKQSQDKARRCTEFLKPYKPRPETTASAARRLVAGALGLASNVPKEKRERERQQLKEAKEKRRKDRKNREDIWEFGGKCAMDEET